MIQLHYGQSVLFPQLSEQDTEFYQYYDSIIIRTKNGDE